MTRKYPTSDVKMLYGRAAGRCAFSDCRKDLILEATEKDSNKQIGKICHIIAHSGGGPRADSTYPADKVDTYENWILLCPTCHDRIDAQDKTYSIDELRKIKSDHEMWIREAIKSAVSDITFAELEVVTKFLISGKYDASGSYTLIPPDEKIKKNGLSSEIKALILSGAMQAKQVGDYINASIDIEFGERLKQGFADKYAECKNDLKLCGDDLFMVLLEFASGGSQDFKQKAAGLAILVYLFERCEVFEK
jgi:hypothetical protein